MGQAIGSEMNAVRETHQNQTGGNSKDTPYTTDGGARSIALKAVRPISCFAAWITRSRRRRRRWSIAHFLLSFFLYLSLSHSRSPQATVWRFCRPKQPFHVHISLLLLRIAYIAKWVLDVSEERVDAKFSFDFGGIYHKKNGDENVIPTIHLWNGAQSVD